MKKLVKYLVEYSWLISILSFATLFFVPKYTEWIDRYWEHIVYIILITISCLSGIVFMFVFIFSLGDGNEQHTKETVKQALKELAGEEDTKEYIKQTLKELMHEMEEKPTQEQ